MSDSVIFYKSFPDFPEAAVKFMGYPSKRERKSVYGDFSYYLEIIHRNNVGFGMAMRKTTEKLYACFCTSRCKVVSSEERREAPLRECGSKA